MAFRKSQVMDLTSLTNERFGFFVTEGIGSFIPELSFVVIFVYPSAVAKIPSKFVTGLGMAEFGCFENVFKTFKFIFVDIITLLAIIIESSRSIVGNSLSVEFSYFFITSGSILSGSATIASIGIELIEDLEDFMRFSIDYLLQKFFGVR